MKGDIIRVGRVEAIEQLGVLGIIFFETVGVSAVSKNERFCACFWIE